MNTMKPIYTKKKHTPNPKRYWLDEKDCERMTRTELNAMKWLLAMLCSTDEAQDDLKHRLECIPNGVARMRMTVGGFRAIVEDLIGTITFQQAKAIQGTMNDYETRIVPKATPATLDTIVFPKEQARELINCAKERCNLCIEDGESCRKCQLYKVLEATVPLDDYGDGHVCPYLNIDWAN